MHLHKMMVNPTRSFHYPTQALIGSIIFQAHRAIVYGMREFIDLVNSQQIFRRLFIEHVNIKMIMNNKYVKIFLAAALFMLCSFMALLTYQYVASLVFMEDEIIFSASVLMVFLSSPLLLYAMLSGIYFFIFNKRPKYDKGITRYLVYLMFTSFVVSLPISLYVDYKLKHIGYFTCDRLSWQSPTTYVKDLSLCR